MSARSPIRARLLWFTALAALFVGGILFDALRRKYAVPEVNDAAVTTDSTSRSDATRQVPIEPHSDGESRANAGQVTRAVVETPGVNDVQDGVVVSVATREGTGVDAKPAARIAFEVWSGHPRMGDSSRLVTGRTDDAGTALVTVPTPSSETYWARVLEPGFLPRAVKMSSSAEARVAIPHAVTEEAPRFSLVAIPGCALAVRVVDEAGRPAAADLRAMALDARGEWTERARDRAVHDGLVELATPVTFPVTLLADGGRFGNGALVVDGPPTPTAAPVTVVLHAPGELQGRVTDGSGDPIAGLELLVLQAELDGERFTLVEREPRAVALQMEGRGQAWSTLMTDVGGLFHATGLRDDRFVVRARTSSTSHYPLRLTTSPVVANKVPLELTLSRPHVVVRITDAEGKPWGAWVSCARRPNRGCGNGNEFPRLDVSIARASANALDPFEDGEVEVKDLGTATFAFDVVAGRMYSIVLQGGGVEFTGCELSVDEGTGRTEIVLVARSSRPSGMLRVRPRSPAGSPFPCPVGMLLEESTTGFRVINEPGPDTEQGTSWITRSVPPGTYTLIVEGSPDLDFMHATVVEYRGCGGSVTSVVVREGETTDVEPVIGQGAQLSIALTGRPDQADRDALTKNHPTMQVGDLEAWASLVRISLLAPNRWPAPVDFRYEMTETSAAGPHLRSELPFGAEQTSELLTSGTYTLEARTRGGRVARVPVVLVDGQTTSVRLEIPSKP